MSTAIRFDGVHRHFNEKRVLNGLTLDVAPGEVFALLGRNGTGKTTALRILLGFLRPHAGSTSVLGVSSADFGPADRAQISYVGENHRLYESMKIRDALDFEAGTRPGYRRDFAERAIARCGMALGHRIHRLSRGQRAQLALILSVGVEPKVLIFDDPALGLDAVMRRELLDAMIDLLSELGCAVLMSSHHLQDVERIADRVGILRDGSLIVDASVDDLKRRVERRIWSSSNGTTPPEHPKVLATRVHRAGVELTLRDVDDATEQVLTANGASLSPRDSLSLEDLFLNLTAPARIDMFGSESA